MSWIRIESIAYWLAVAITFLGAAIWESFRPNRELSVSTERRWGKHAILFLVCSAISIALYRVSPVVIALAVSGKSYGVLNQAWLPFTARCVLAVLVLDLVKYSTHWAYHHVPFLWRIHQVHHSDPDFDVSTGLRVHPLEVILTQAAYLGVIAVLAPPVLSVVLAEAISSIQSFFGHANASLPGWVEKPIRAVFVTPDMHRIHHSEDASEQGKNLGDILPWWDHLFGTYAAEPSAGPGMIVGLKGFQTSRSLDVGFMLTQPFQSLTQQLERADTPVPQGLNDQPELTSADGRGSPITRR